MLQCSCPNVYCLLRLLLHIRLSLQWIVLRNKMYVIGFFYLQYTLTYVHLFFWHPGLSCFGQVNGSLILILASSDNDVMPTTSNRRPSSTSQPGQSGDAKQQVFGDSFDLLLRGKYKVSYAFKVYYFVPLRLSSCVVVFLCLVSFFL